MKCLDSPATVQHRRVALPRRGSEVQYLLVSVANDRPGSVVFVLLDLPIVVRNDLHALWMQPYKRSRFALTGYKRERITGQEHVDDKLTRKQDPRRPTVGPFHQLKERMILDGLRLFASPLDNALGYLGQVAGYCLHTSTHPWKARHRCHGVYRGIGTATWVVSDEVRPCYVGRAAIRLDLHETKRTQNAREPTVSNCKFRLCHGSRLAQFRIFSNYRFISC